MNVSANLLDYLKTHDRAELIGVGTFFAKNTPASMSPITNTLTPPRREVTFSNEQNKDMGFVQSLAKSEFISEETALKWITQYSDSIKEKLDTLGECKVGQLGLLKKDSLSGLSFTEQTGLNLLATSFAFSSLKNVKTFDKGDYIDTIKTKKPLQPIVEEKKEEEKPQEREQNFGSTESIVIATAREQKVAENTEDSEPSVRDYIKPREENSSANSVEVEQTEEKKIVFEERDAVEENAQQIKENQQEVQRRLQEQEYNNDVDKTEQENTEDHIYIEPKKHHKHKMPKRTKRFWKVIATIVFVLFLLCAFVVFAHYMCWLKKYPQCKTLSAKLNTLIVPKCDKTVPAKTAVVTPTETVSETPMEETITPTTNVSKEYTVAPVPKDKKMQQPKASAQKGKTSLAANSANTKAAKAKKAKKAKVSGEKDNPPKPTVEIDYTTPIMMQSVSRLGFDVVGSTATNRSTAEQSARVARSQGYDSYIISKNGKYYVSYGSRRTSGEANAFMKQISKKSGDKGFYIISR